MYKVNEFELPNMQDCPNEPMFHERVKLLVTVVLVGKVGCGATGQIGAQAVNRLI
jgi:hypothetical protein